MHYVQKKRIHTKKTKHTLTHETGYCCLVWSAKALTHSSLKALEEQCRQGEAHVQTHALSTEKQSSKGGKGGGERAEQQQPQAKKFKREKEEEHEETYKDEEGGGEAEEVDKDDDEDAMHVTSGGVGGCLPILQKTPLRVLHRRSLITRKRNIFDVQMALLSPHFFLLNLVTSAGTYVKEFVHGDLGRTTPSISSMLECQADILQLDVVWLYDDYEGGGARPDTWKNDVKSSTGSGKSWSDLVAMRIPNHRSLPAAAGLPPSSSLSSSSSSSLI